MGILDGVTSLEVTVEDVDGNRIRGAWVAAESHDGSRRVAPTDRDGVYLFEMLRRGDFRVRVVANQFVEHETRMRLGDPVRHKAILRSRPQPSQVH